jgi:DUF4097 and DUF4098 domain-containing protein YvlB
MFRKTCGLLAVALSLGATVTIAAQQTFDKRFDAPPGGHLTVQTDIGSVAIVGSDTREVLVHVDMSDSDHLDVEAEQNASGVSVTGHREQLTWFGSWRNSVSHVRFKIVVPRDYPVELQTSGGSLDLSHLSAPVAGQSAGGSVTLRDIVGPIDARTSGGSVDAQNIHGPTRLGTSGGGITIADATGDLDLRTLGGSINLRSADGKVTAATSGGSVRAEVRINRGIDLASSGGPITLLIPESVRASIDANTSGGSVQSDLPVTRTEAEQHSRLRGTLNGGGEPIILDSSGGGIHIEQLR